MTSHDGLVLLAEKAEREARSGDFAALLLTEKLLAASGVPTACTNIGLTYETGGGGVERDLNLAMEWYEKGATEFNDSGAHLALGRIYSAGNGVKQDYVKAHDHLQQAFLLKRPEAGVLLGVMYLNGQGIERNTSKARHYFEFAASSGYLFAKARLLHIEYKSAGFHLAAYLRGLKLIWEVNKCTKQNPRDPRLYGFTRK